MSRSHNEAAQFDRDLLERIFLIVGPVLGVNARCGSRRGGKSGIDGARFDGSRLGIARDCRQGLFLGVVSGRVNEPVGDDFVERQRLAIRIDAAEPRLEEAFGAWNAGASDGLRLVKETAQLVAALGIRAARAGGKQ